MSELNDVSAGLNRALIGAQLEHAAQHAGEAQLKSFNAAVDEIAERYTAKFDGIAFSSGVDVSSAKNAMAALVAKVKTNAAKAGAVEPPKAA